MEFWNIIHLSCFEVISTTWTVMRDLKLDLVSSEGHFVHGTAHPDFPKQSNCLWVMDDRGKFKISKVVKYMSGIAMFICSMWCVMSVWRALCDAVCFVMLCVWKASVYLSKRINSSLLTKIFNGIRWGGCVTQRQRAILGRPLLFIVQWVIRNKAWFKHNYKTMWWMESPHDIYIDKILRIVDIIG